MPKPCGNCEACKRDFKQKCGTCKFCTHSNLHKKCILRVCQNIGKSEKKEVLEKKTLIPLVPEAPKNIIETVLTKTRIADVSHICEEVLGSEQRNPHISRLALQNSQGLSPVLVSTQVQKIEKVFRKRSQQKYLDSLFHK